MYLMYKFWVHIFTALVSAVTVLFAACLNYFSASINGCFLLEMGTEFGGGLSWINIRYNYNINLVCVTLISSQSSFLW